MDEVQRILYYIKENASLGRAYKVTDELFDLSTMAMEYFKEHIEPTLDYQAQIDIARCWHFFMKFFFLSCFTT